MKTRTMFEAMTEGTFFQIEMPGWLQGPCFPAAESPAETLLCARSHGWIEEGRAYRATRIVEGRIGSYMVEDAGTIALLPPTIGDYLTHPVSRTCPCYNCGEAWQDDDEASS